MWAGLATEAPAPGPLCPLIIYPPHLRNVPVCRRLSHPQCTAPALRKCELVFWISPFPKDSGHNGRGPSLLCPDCPLTNATCLPSPSLPNAHTLRYYTNFFRARVDTDASVAVWLKDCHREMAALLIPSPTSSTWRTVSLPYVHVAPQIAFPEMSKLSKRQALRQVWVWPESLRNFHSS